MRIFSVERSIPIPFRLRSAAWIATLTFGFILAINMTASAQLMEYIRRPDPAFKWQHVATQRVKRGRIYKLYFVSQVWEGIRWEHQLQIYEPNDVRYTNVMLLWVTGGSAGKNSINRGFRMAEHAGMRVAILYQIPDQPLFGGKREDELIAYTFVRYLHTHNANWPLLFPMTKSVIKAMDVIQAFAPQAWGSPSNKFIVGGASKRGWTTWLAASTGDPRVVAIAPMAIDTLRFPAQLKHQLAVYGHYSRQIHNYTNAGLLKPSVLKTPASRRLWHMVDPYTYQKHLILPKLIVRGTNDPYWTQDALNLYWNNLRGGKWVLYVPNAGHNMREKGDDDARMLDTLGAFARHVASSTPMPSPRWSYLRETSEMRLTIHTRQISEAARLWVAHSATLDFRKSHWTSLRMKQAGSRFTATVPLPYKDNVALFGEVRYTFNSQPYTLSTQVQIVRGTATSPAVSAKGR
ncbi:MAG TPA: PhoPQ-activated protein PqaA family protein [Terriglobia bacterium]|nr:PhoPQ-activated protein PqaA family protein [Terriglobia bacterium]